jgi:hypothetical protein
VESAPLENGAIVSDPVTIAGTIMRVAPPYTSSQGLQDAYVFRGGRVTGFYTFRLEKNEVAKEFMANSSNGPVSVRGRIRTAPESAQLVFEPESIVEAPEEQLPPFGLTLEEAPLTSLEEEALFEMMRVAIVAFYAHPDPNVVEQFRRNMVAAFDQSELNPGMVGKEVQTPFSLLEQEGGGAVGTSLTGLIEEEGDDLTNCLYTILKAIGFFVLGLGLTWISKIIRERTLTVCRDFMKDGSIVDALRQILDVLKATGLRRGQRGDMMKAALLNFAQVAGPSIARGFVWVFKKLPWHEYIIATASLLANIAAPVKICVKLFGLMNTFLDIVANCAFSPEAECQYVT